MGETRPGRDFAPHGHCVSIGCLVHAMAGPNRQANKQLCVMALRQCPFYPCPRFGNNSRVLPEECLSGLQRLERRVAT